MDKVLIPNICFKMNNKKYFSKKAEKFELKYLCLCLLHGYKYFIIRPIFSSVLFFGMLIIVTSLLAVRDGIFIFHFETFGLSLLTTFVSFFGLFFPCLISEHSEIIPNGTRLLLLNKRCIALSLKSAGKEKTEKMAQLS